MKDIKQSVHTSLSKIDVHYWKCEDHVKNIKKEYWHQEGLSFIQPSTVVHLADSSDSD